MSSRERAEKAALDNLNVFGSDTERDHPMEFFLYFPEELQAYSAAAQLFNLQFKVNVSFSKSSKDWLCFATKEIKPTSDRMGQLSNFLEKLAEENGGFYDGWGTPIINENYPEDNE